MQDYKNYVFADLGATDGGNANNWKAALEALPGKGYGVNPKPGEKQPLDAPHHGVTVMIDGGGNARGRIWLPTDVATFDDHGNAWYTHEVQVIADGPVPGTMVWAWDSKGGAAPRPFNPTTEPPVEPPTEPPTSDHEARIAALEADVAELQSEAAAVRSDMAKIALAAARAAITGATVDVRVGRNYGHGHEAKGTIVP